MENGDYLPRVAATCPFCRSMERECAHFLGWTKDGKTVEVWTGLNTIDLDPVRHRVVEIGPSVRVYSQVIVEDLKANGSIR